MDHSIYCTTGIAPLPNRRLISLSDHILVEAFGPLTLCRTQLYHFRNSANVQILHGWLLLRCEENSVFEMATAACPGSGTSRLSRIFAQAFAATTPDYIGVRSGPTKLRAAELTPLQPSIKLPDTFRAIVKHDNCNPE